MSREELLVLKKYLDDNLAKGFIRPSNSAAASPVLFVRKPGGGLRFCVDYRGLNALTVKNRYPLPLIRETLDRLNKAKYFTKLDIIAAFNKLRMAKGDEWLTAFRTRYGLYEYLVMPFGLSNAPSSFQHYINDTLRDFLDKFATAYIDDILIYSNTLAEHRKHVRQVLERLKTAGLQVDIDKCEFHQQSVKYLGLIISTDGIRMDPDKIRAVIEWAQPRLVKELQGFLGFANFYRRFIKDYSRVVLPLINLTRKDQPYLWRHAQESAFQELKNRFTSAPILQHFDFELPTRVESDASDGVTGAVLSQQHADGLWKPVAYLSKKMTPAECNYDIYDKELLAIIHAFEEWRPELEGTEQPVQVHSDHKNLLYFMKSKLLNRRQARWSEFLSRFNFVISYTPGSMNSRADGLTRRSGDLPADRGDGEVHATQVVLKPHNLDVQLAPAISAAPVQLRDANDDSDTSTPSDFPDDSSTLSSERGDDDAVSDTDLTDADEKADVDESIADVLGRAYAMDEFTIGLRQALSDAEQQYEEVSLSEFEYRDRRIWYRGRTFVPDFEELRRRIIETTHDPPAAGHPGIAKTYELLRRSWFWPNVHEDVARYVRNCGTCRRAKAPRDKYHGLLKPLEPPHRRWTHVTMDFIVDLPLSKTIDGAKARNILVVVDRLTKMRHLIPCDSMTAKQTARLFYAYIWKHHGLPDHITSDRGTQFVAAFWKRLCALLRINASLSTAYHPETDGQTEIVNAVLEQSLRCFCNYLQDDWAQWLPTAEFSANNWDSSSTGLSPFYANTGQHPRTAAEPPALTMVEGTTRVQLESQAADEFAQDMDRIEKALYEEIVYAQAVHEKQANRRRGPAPNYAVGDRVYLSARNMKTYRPSKKLDWKHLGPYVIAEKISPQAYRLELPDTMRIHNVFHVNLLRPCPTDPLPGQALAAPPPVYVDDIAEYAVQDIVDSVEEPNGEVLYQVQWEGYDELTWEPWEHVNHLAAYLTRFHRRYPLKPRHPAYMAPRRSSAT